MVGSWCTAPLEQHRLIQADQVATTARTRRVARSRKAVPAHLGLTRRQVVVVVAGEGAAWMAAGTLVGLALGIAVSLVLPWGRLAALCAAVMVAGTLTAAVTARSAAGRQAVLSVKEDW
jgi:putative ABC transport system permease protein